MDVCRHATPRHCLIGVIVDDSSTGGQIPGEN